MISRFNVSVLAALAALGIFAYIPAARAAIPRTISFQGVLASPSGAPKPNGVYTLVLRLYDAPSGGSVVWTEPNQAVTVSGGKGLFSTTLGAPTSFGSLAFDIPYYLEVQAQGEASPMTPRFSLKAVPYAFSTGTANLALPFTGSASVATPGATLSITNTGSGTAISAVGKLGNGVYGLSGGTSGLSPAYAFGYGVKGDSGNGFGVIGQSYSAWGVYGQQGAPSGYTPPYVAGMWGDSSANVGAMGTSATNAGLAGYSTGSNGVFGISGGSDGVIGYSSAAAKAGVAGVSNGASPGNGVYGRSDNGGAGVYATSANGTGVFGLSNVGAGVYGESISNGAGTGNHGVFGLAHVSARAGVYGQNDAPGAYGMFGSAQGAGSIGVLGTASGNSSSKGVYGSTLGGYGVWGTGDSTGGIGVHGQAANGAYGELGTAVAGAAVGVHGQAPIGAYGDLGRQYSNGFSAGVYGNGVSGSWAGYFSGDVFITGFLGVAGSKNFKIDHPLDPANKFLVHACAEGPDALNIYTGNITTDAEGKAVVQLPSYFEAENKDFRYQLTIVEDDDSAGFTQAKVSRKVKDNRFSIRTDKPNAQVSWQVMGVRNDAYMRAHPINVEEDKGAERGHYLMPELFGKPQTMQIGYSPAPGPR